MRTTFERATARRLARHGLAGPVPGDRLAAQAGVMCGVHAQVMSAAEISLALRVEGGTREAVREALWSDHALIKTYGPRGTVHVFPAADLAVWAGALGAAAPASRFADGVRLTAAQEDEVVAAIGAALSGGELTADELGDEVVARTGPWAGDLVMPAFQGMWPRWRQAINVAAHRGVLCFGPNRGRKVTYTNPGRFVPGFAPVAAGEADAAVLHRFLHAYGPATPQQFAQWLAVSKTWAARVFETADIERVTVDGAEAWVNAGDTGFGEEPSGVRLLPYFDAYVVGSHPRERLFPGRAVSRALDGGQAGTFPVLLVDGVVAGVWHQKAGRRRTAITVEALDEPGPALRAAIEEQAERIAAIQGLTAALTFGEITVGAHA
ncbi:hypothetical protein Afil01_15390 [Actinorhabdospora filicis]|uniref:Winged helix DNA-binding domain-containing protein n=1 Tax=Actinorhabdospora filicis TaxID=1785913 RepID=A0A9W6W283_9ACTN|nr:winged helix DNA-binding domain-containing protein [Actinorhabdospora filicis]GLZ76732.1 hypothetical protein Afil01_15390 [Actinorhabdospora filicis]